MEPFPLHHAGDKSPWPEGDRCDQLREGQKQGSGSSKAGGGGGLPLLCSGLLCALYDCLSRLCIRFGLYCKVWRTEVFSIIIII